MEEKKLGLRSVISTSVGLVIATSCLVSLGQGAGEIGTPFIWAMVIACAFNMISMASMSELNALMPNTTGGLAQYTLASVGPWPTLVCMVGGYILSSVLSAGVEASIFAYAIGEVFHLPLPNVTYSIIITIVLLIANLRGIDMFAKVQDLVVYLMLGSMLVLGFIGAIGMGTGAEVQQPAALATDFKSVISMTGVAFWLFIGAEYAIPISKDVSDFQPGPKTRVSADCTRRERKPREMAEKEKIFPRQQNAGQPWRYKSILPWCLRDIRPHKGAEEKGRSRAEGQTEPRPRADRTQWQTENRQRKRSTAPARNKESDSLPDSKRFAIKHVLMSVSYVFLSVKN